MPKRGHQPRGLLNNDPGIFVVTVSATTVDQGSTVEAFAQFATSEGSPVALAGKVVTWGKIGSGGVFNNATSSTDVAGVARVQLTVGTRVGATYQVTATASGGITGTSPTITVSADDVPDAIAVTPSTASLTVGGTATLTAVVKNKVGDVLSGVSLVWVSSAPLTVSTTNLGSTATLSALAIGSASVYAQYGAVKSNTVAVTSGQDTTPVSLSIAPTTASITGGTLQFVPLFKNAAGETISGLAPTAWQSSSPAVATISSAGLLTYVGAGSTTITATYASLTSNSATVTATAGGGGGGTQDIDVVDLPTLLSTDVSDTPRSGRTVNCANATQFAAALADLQAGDWIKNTSGTDFAGAFVVNRAASAGNWCWIDCSGSKPAEHTRFNGATDKATYTPPRLVANSGSPVLRFASGAAYIRVMGHEITVDAGVSTCNTVVAMGDGTETSAGALPHHIILDRNYIHGHSTLECRRLVALQNASGAVIDNYLADAHSTGFDTQAVWGWNGTGPYKVVNNYLEASTEVIGFGGADPALVGNIPSDVEIRRNHITRPYAWKALIDGQGAAHWLEKNLVELKVGRRVLIEGNVLENAWVKDQAGWAFVLWAVNQNGGNSAAETSHITIRKNILKNVASGFQITQQYASGPTQGTHHLAISNNVAIGAANAQVPNDGPFILLQNQLPNVSLDHNTFVVPDSLSSAFMIVNPDPFQTLRVRNNIIGGGHYPLFVSPGPTWTARTDANSRFQGNVCPEAADMAGAFAFPSGNSYPATTAALGGVGSASDWTDVNASLSNLALASTSTYKNQATDNTDPGADIAAVITATTGVVIP